MIIALVSFAAVTALGVGMAGADPASKLADGQPAESTTAPPTITTVEPTACANEIDDDGDGLVDSADPDCTSPLDTSEAPETPAEPVSEEPTGAPTPAPPPVLEAVSPGVRATATPNTGGTQQGSGGGVKRNDTLSASGASTGVGGGLTAPSATAGVQPPVEASGGGSAFTGSGVPTPVNPSTTIAPFGPAPIGVPNFVIDSFEIPPFLLPIYQACGTEYGIPWEVLASINKIETAFGTNLNVSTAGAVGWMQFLPSTWETYGVDANGDGRRDPYNPVDAICAAANYLKASGGAGDLYNAILSYNHADWYVQEVLLYAHAYGKLPTDLVGSLTGLTEGAHFPVAANARYADDISVRAALRQATPQQRAAYGNAAQVVASSPTRRGINIYSHRGAPVVAVNDGVIEKIGSSKRLGHYIVLQDAYGNRYTYAELGRIVRRNRSVVMPTGKERRVAVDSENIRPRLFALPGRAQENTRFHAPQPVDKAAATGAKGKLRVGSKVIAGTVLARIGAGKNGVNPHINFSIRPAGRGAPRIDPKPI
ncbi:MAG: lytic murein transglycosylase, partial [Solirubrobacterales bacterium]